jgi:anti-sigma regulatory factor (Ser/Thr protein kinase)
MRYADPPVDVKLPPTLEAPVWAREWVGEALESVSQDRRDAARLLVSELVTSSVRDADLSPQDSIVIRVDLSHERVRVEVIDPGETFNPPERREAEPGAGAGLVLLDRIADRWGVRSDGVPAVWFELDLA